MAYASITYTGDGDETTFAIPFGYINTTDITVTVDGEEVDATVSDAEVVCDVAPADDSVVVITRVTLRSDPEVTFTDGAARPASELNKSALQALYLCQELLDGAGVVGLDGDNLLFGTAAARPAAGTANRAYFATDTGEFSVDTGSVWIANPDSALTGDVTKSPGSTTTTIAALSVTAGKLAANSVITSKILAGNVTLAKLADLAAYTVIGRASGTGVPTALSCTAFGQSIMAAANAAAALVLLGLTADAAQPTISVHRNAVNQTAVVTATYTVVEHDTEAWDVGSAFDADTTHRWTPLLAGYYLVEASAQLVNLADTKHLRSAIFKNGSLYKESRSYSGDASEDTVDSVTCIVYMNGSTDYIEHQVRHNHGSDRTISGAISTTFLQGRRIGA